MPLTHSNELKHILFLRWLPPHGEWGGMEKLILEWLERIDYAKARVSLAVMPEWKEKFSKEINNRNLSVDVIAIPFEFNHDYGQRFQNFYAFFKQLNPQTIIFVQGLYTEFHLGDVIAARLISRHVFMHENLQAPAPIDRRSKLYFGCIKGLGLWWYAHRSYINLRALFCSHVLVVSQSMQKTLTELWGYPAKKVKVAYHGITTANFRSSAEKRSKLRRQLDISPYAPVIIATARLARQKRLDRLIEAFDVLAEEFHDLELLIAGDGPLEAELKALAQEKRSDARIRFLGRITQVQDYLQMADYYVLSSDNEGLSIALMEAMAAGLICVSTDCAGSQEVISNGFNGFLVEKSMEGIYQGLRQALNLRKEERYIMSANAQATVKHKFDINFNTKNVFQLMGVPAYGI